MNSDKLPGVKSLRTPNEAKRFLLELANMGDRPEESARFWRRCKEFFPPGAFELSKAIEAELPSDRQWQPGQPAWTTREELSAEQESRLLQTNLLQMRNWLREAWTIADPGRKEWKLFELRQKFHQLAVDSEERMTEPPPASGMDYALRYLWKIADKSRHCANADCRITPYFLVERRGRSYCSETCARPAQQEYKQRWWEQHRAEISKNRKEKYRKKKASGRRARR